MSRSPEERASRSGPRLTEARNPRTRGIDRASPAEIVGTILAEDRAVLPAVQAESEAIAELIERVEARIRDGGRLFYVGAGTSGRLGVLDAAECPPTFGTDPDLVQGIIAGGPVALTRSREGAEDDREAGRRALADARVGARDFVLGIAASGATPFVLAALREARGRGAGVGFLSCTEPPAEARSLAHVVVTPLVGPEVIAGSTRMKAGTATKLVLNTLSTGVMIRRGKVFENLMVDLRAASAKLADRSLRIVQEAAAVEREEARVLLLEAGGRAKTAIAMARLEADRITAERLLDACEGFLGRVLERFDAGGPFPVWAAYPEEVSEDRRTRILERLQRGPSAVRRARERSVLPATEARDALVRLVRLEATVVPRTFAKIGTGREEAFGEHERARARVSGTGAKAGQSDALVDRFAGARADTLLRVRSLSPDDWSRSVRVEGERVRLVQFLAGVAGETGTVVRRLRDRIHPDLRTGS